ncbi:MAG: ArsR/SmtB family transcription factor [Promethearchaeota archaeon]
MGNIKKNIIDKLKGCCRFPNFQNYFREIQEIGLKLREREEYINLANFGLAISSIERITILKMLNERDMCVCELEVLLEKSQSTISHHLRKLERANLVKSWKQGPYTYYGLKLEILKEYINILVQEFNISL